MHTSCPCPGESHIHGGLQRDHDGTKRTEVIITGIVNDVTSRRIEINNNPVITEIQK